MPRPFKVTLTVKDMYRFNLYHTYTSFQGIFSLILGAAVLILSFTTLGEVSLAYTLLYAVFGVVFLVYNPIALYSASKRRLQKTDALHQEMVYQFQEEGIKVSIGEEEAVLPWKQIYKIVATGKDLLIYSNRRNAYVIPQEQIQEEEEQIAACLKEEVEPYRLKIKKLGKRV